MAANRKTLRTPDGFDAYFRPTPLAGKVTPVDPKLQAEVAQVLRKDHPHLFAQIADFLPPAAGGRIQGLTSGIVQADYIADLVLPRWVGGPLETAYYPILGEERFYTSDSTIALNAKPKRDDVNIDFGTVTVQAKAREAASERREQAAAQAGASMDILAYKAGVEKDKLDLERERDVAGFVATAANYAATYSQTLATTGQWSHTSSTPVDEFFLEREKLRSGARLTSGNLRNLLFVMGPAVLFKLKLNTQIRALAATAFTGGTVSSVPVTDEFLAALFGVTIVVGGAGYAATPGAAITDVWGKFAALIHNGGDEPIARRFGINVTTEGYPSTMEYFDPSVGTKGADVVKQADAWKPQGISSNAGYLWFAAVA